MWRHRKIFRPPTCYLLPLILYRHWHSIIQSAINSNLPYLKQILLFVLSNVLWGFHDGGCIPWEGRICIELLLLSIIRIIGRCILQRQTVIVHKNAREVPGFNIAIILDILLVRSRWLVVGFDGLIHKLLLWRCSFVVIIWLLIAFVYGSQLLSYLVFTLLLKEWINYYHTGVVLRGGHI